jgi:hypothetical protein
MGGPNRYRLCTEQSCHACQDDKRRERHFDAEKMQCHVKWTGHNYSIAAHSHSTFTLCRLLFTFSLHMWQGVHLSDGVNICYVCMHKAPHRRLKCTYGNRDIKTVTCVTGALVSQSRGVKTWPHLYYPYCSLQQCLHIDHTPSSKYAFIIHDRTIIWKGQDGSVGIATRYGLDDPGIRSRWGARFSIPIHTGPGARPASYTMGTESFPGVKRPGPGIDHPPPSSAEVKERVQLYLYSPFVPSWPILGWILPLLDYRMIIEPPWLSMGPMLQAGWHMIWQPARDFSYLQNVQTGSGAHPTFYSVATRSSFPGCKADPSLSSIAKVKSKWNYTSAFPIHLCGVHRDHYRTFTVVWLDAV